jgi:hypothetical protein
LNPVPIEVINADGVNVRYEPTTTSNSVFTKISFGQRFVGFGRYIDGDNTWYRVYLPCGKSSCAGWVAGVYNGTTYSTPVTETNLLQVKEADDYLGLSVRTVPGGSKLDKVFDLQRFVTFESETVEGSGCFSPWYRIYLPLSSSSPTNSGWVCGDYVHLSSNIQAGPVSLSGTVTGPQGLSVASISLGLTGAASMTTSPDGDGAYAFTSVADGSFTITPTITGYGFSPTSRAVTVSGAAVGGLDFRACQTGQALTGVLLDQNNQPIAGTEATITVDGNVSGTLDANGNYSVTGLDCGDHTLTITPIGSAGFQTINLPIDSYNGWTANFQWAV